MSFHTLHIASGFLQTSKLQAEITGRNLAGANKAGYSRQRAVLEDVGPGLTSFERHPDGLGVIVTSFERVRDGLLDRAYRTHHREAEGARSIQPLAGRLESVLGQTESLAEASQETRQVLLEVASHPEDPALREDLLSKLDGLSDRFQTTHKHLLDLSTESKERSREEVARVNDILDQLSEINKRLPATKGSSGRNAVMDQRDLLLDELSGLAEVRIVPQAGEAVAVYLDGKQLLYGSNATHLEISGGQLLTEHGTPVSIDEGSLAAHLDFAERLITQEISTLDTIARQFRDELNAVHRMGYGLDGVGGRDLFTGTGAGDLALAISAPEALAASGSIMEGTTSLHTGTFVADQSLASQAGSMAVPAAPSGTLEVNGSPITWNDGESLSDILGKFSTAGVEARYDQSSGRVILERDPSVAGPLDITVTDLSGNLSQTLRLDTANSRAAIPGDGKVARALATRLENKAFGSGGSESFEESLSGLRTRAGSFARNAADQAERNGLLESDADLVRTQSSGVSTDEELLQLERFQQSFAAAARVATVADELLTTLINMGRG